MSAWRAVAAGALLASLSACVAGYGGAGAPAPVASSAPAAEPVYQASECTGPVIMGRCHGQILGGYGYVPRCHGQWLAGQCTGPMF